MNCNEVVREIMARKEYNTTSLRVKLGIAPDKSNRLIGRMNQENMSIETLDSLVSAMGYMIVVMPDNAKIPKDGIKVDYTETEAAAKRKAEYRKRSKERREKMKEKETTVEQDG